MSSNRSFSILLSGRTITHSLLSGLFFAVICLVTNLLLFLQASTLKKLLPRLMTMYGGLERLSCFSGLRESIYATLSTWIRFSRKFPFLKCYYCDNFQTNMKKEYLSYSVINHPLTVSWIYNCLTDRREYLLYKIFKTDEGRLIQMWTFSVHVIMII